LVAVFFIGKQPENAQIAHPAVLARFFFIKKKKNCFVPVCVVVGSFAMLLTG
jgi:hypothetical protein